MEVEDMAALANGAVQAKELREKEAKEQERSVEQAFSEFPEFSRTLAIGLDQLVGFKFDERRKKAFTARFKKLLKDDDKELLRKILYSLDLLVMNSGGNRQQTVLEIWNAAFSNQICSKTQQLCKVKGRYDGDVELMAGSGGIGIKSGSRTKFVFFFDDVKAYGKYKAQIASGLRKIGKEEMARRIETFYNILESASEDIFDESLTCTLTLRRPLLVMSHDDSVGVADAFILNHKEYSSSKGSLFVEQRKFYLNDEDEEKWAFEEMELETNDAGVVVSLDSNWGNVFLWLQLREELHKRIDELVDASRKRVKLGSDIIDKLKNAFKRELLVAGV